MCASQENAPPAVTSRPTCHGSTCCGAIPTPTAQANTNMYAPGGPTDSALHNSTAIIAMTETASTPVHGVTEAQSPTATATPKHTATTAR
ncbi:hypothetical protein [Mycolicibacterium thermoresistibile]